MGKRLRVAMIAGEASGDFLGAGLIQAMQAIHPNIEFIGIGGPLMRELGFNAIYSTEKIAMMGISDVLRSLPKLKWIHSRISRYLLANPPDLFVGIDAPDFNLSIETRLRGQGVKVAHYVSPKVWAWRPERVHTIKKAVDLLLLVFPFEVAFYEPYGVPVKYVGHALADLIEMTTDTVSSKINLGFAPDQTVIAVLPGSRHGELRHMGPLFIEVMQQIQLRRPDIHFIVPLGSEALKKQFTKQLHKKNYRLNLQLTEQNSRDVMAASEVVIVKSGTCTLEAALLKKPMVVAFKVSRLTHCIVAPRVSVLYTALPNLLVNKPLVPEFIQQQANPVLIAEAALDFLMNEKKRKCLEAEFTDIHQTLKHDASKQSAKALFELIC